MIFDVFSIRVFVEFSESSSCFLLIRIFLYRLASEWFQWQIFHVSYLKSWYLINSHLHGKNIYTFFFVENLISYKFSINYIIRLSTANHSNITFFLSFAIGEDEILLLLLLVCAIDLTIMNMNFSPIFSRLIKN